MSPCKHVNFAIAHIYGAPEYPQIQGTVWFQNAGEGTFVSVKVMGLPFYQPGPPGGNPIGPHGFHLHEFGNCSIGNPADPFQAAGGHWNPDNQPHGHHAGDFPVLFSNHGLGEMCFFTDRFKVSEIIGRSVIIHENPDDYRTQPSGNSGRRIACGLIESTCY